MYQTNDLIQIKREALTNGDIPMLRDIRDYEGNLSIYYKKAGEEAIRTKSGQVVTLNMSLSEIMKSLHAGSPTDQKPGELLERIQAKKPKTLIIEIAANAEFPITGSNLSVLRAEHSTDDDRIAGIEFRRPCPGVYFLSIETMTQEQLADILSFTQSNDY